jgi:hypothetical protein
MLIVRFANPNGFIGESNTILEVARKTQDASNFNDFSQGKKDHTSFD